MRNLILALITLSSFFLFSCSSDTELPAVSSPDPVEQMMEEENLEDAPDFSLKTINDTDLSLTQFEDKVLVIFFFGHNCPPCVSVGPTIESDLNKKFSTKSDFAIIGIDLWDGNVAQVEKFINSTNTSYSIGMNGSAVAKEFKAGRDRLVVVNKAGKIAFNGTSVAKNNLDEVTDIINILTD